jgi:phytoene dehydrogenase-like protein
MLTLFKSPEQLAAEAALHDFVLSLEKKYPMWRLVFEGAENVVTSGEMETVRRLEGAVDAAKADTMRRYIAQRDAEERRLQALA